MGPLFRRTRFLALLALSLAAPGRAQTIDIVHGGDVVPPSASQSRARAPVQHPAPASATVHPSQSRTLGSSSAYDAILRLLDASSGSHAARVLGLFNGPPGLIGVIVAHRGDDQRGIVWITEDHKTIILGAVYDAQGENLTRRAMYDQGILEAPEAALTSAASPTAMGILIGTHGPVLTAFVDPNCIFCHQLYESLKSPIRAGKLRVRYVLVGILKASSVARAAAILSAKEPATALARDEAKYDLADEEGGYPGGQAPKLDTTGARAAVTANTALMFRTGGAGTPTFLYCDSATKRVTLRSGLPSDFTNLLSRVGAAGSEACH